MTETQHTPHDDHTIVTPGEVVGGKFLVEHIIGEGGMGVVVAATHQQLGERVALKFLRLVGLGNPEIVARFGQEARAAARLKSAHIARVLDVGSKGDIPFMVMEFLEGKDLARTIHTNGALPVEEAVDYVIQACEGLAEAHARGIVHRDIKPENLFLVDSNGWKGIKILDFGISKAVLSGGAPNAALIQTSNIMGSPCYMSPEQLRSTKNVDHRADIWSVGAVLFELLTATTPFDVSGSLAELIGAVTFEPPRDPRATRPEIPEGLAAICLRCLEKDPANRFQSVAELAVALLDFAPKRAYTAVERAVAFANAGGISSVRLTIENQAAHAATHVSVADSSRGSSKIKVITGPEQPRIPGTSSAKVVGSSQTKISGASLSSSGSLGAEGERAHTNSAVSASPVESKTSRFLPFAMVGVASVLAVTAFVVTRTPPSTTTQQPSTATTESISVVLRAEPREARFTIDNGPPLDNPYIGKFSKDNSMHVVRATAPGYKEKTRDVAFSGDVNVGLLLTKDTAAPGK